MSMSLSTSLSARRWRNDGPSTSRRPSAACSQHADIIVTARAGGLLVGISRAITDHSFCTYLSDLAVDREYQGRGIGKELIRRTHEVGRACTPR